MKKLICTMVALCTAALLCCTMASAATLAEGDGWTLTDDGVFTLTVSTNYGADADSTPWKNYKSSIKEAVINASATSAYAFADCTNLEKVTFEKSLYLRDYSFQNCTALKEIDLTNVTQIRNEAFAGSGLESVTLPEGLTYYSGSDPELLKYYYWSIFENCTSLKSVTLPDDMTTIGNSMFQGCSSLTEITLPDSLVRIGNNAFHTTDLRRIIIPEGVTFIGGDAFYKCKNLDRMSIPSTMTTLTDRCFKYTGDNTGWTVYYNGTQAEWDALWATTAQAQVTTQPTVVTGTSLANLDVSAAMGEQVSVVNENDETDTAVGVVSTLKNIDAAAEELTTAVWDVTADGTTKSFTWNLPGKVTLESGAEAKIGLIINGLTAMDACTVAVQ